MIKKFKINGNYPDTFRILQCTHENLEEVREFIASTDDNQPIIFTSPQTTNYAIVIRNLIWYVYPDCEPRYLIIGPDRSRTSIISEAVFRDRFTEVN
jgi:hypothetical protein